MEYEISKKLDNDENVITFRLITYPCIPENRYYVSENGDIYDAIKGKMRKSVILKRGYKAVAIKHRSYLIHRLVAWEFCPENRSTHFTVDHIDGNKLNNNYKNLEWVSLADNIRRSYTNGLHPERDNYSADLIHQICELYMIGKSPIEVYRIIRKTDNTPRGNKKEESFYRLLVSIRKKETREDIVSQYNFPDTYSDGYRLPSDDSLLTIEQIKIVAQLYIDGKNYVDILRTLNIDRKNSLFQRYYCLVMRICQRQSWTNITDPIFDGFSGEIVTVRNGGRFTESQVRRICELFRDGSKDPIKLLSMIGIRKGHPDFSVYYDGIMSIVHGKAWTRISKDYFTPTTFSKRQFHNNLDDEFIYEMLNQGYGVKDIARMYGLGSKKENQGLYRAIIKRVIDFRKIKNTLEFHLSKDDIETGKINIWANQF